MDNATFLAQSTAQAQKAAAAIGGIFTQGVGFTPGTVKAPVITSKTATNDLQKNIIPGYSKTMDSLANHTQALAQDKATTQQLQAQQKTQDQQSQSKSQPKQELTTVSDVPYGYNQRQVTYSDGSTAILNQTTNEDGTVSYSEDPQEAAAAKAQTALDAQQKDYQAKADQVTATISNIQKGAIPLTAGESAQVSALQASYENLIQQQTQQNASSAGLENIRGYQTGAAEYDPSFQVKVIGGIVSAGVAKLADLNVKMAGALANLTQSFHDNDIKAVKDSWDVYQSAAKDRADHLQQTVDSVQKAISDARNAAIKQQDEQLKVEKDARDFAYKQSQDTIKNKQADQRIAISQQNANKSKKSTAAAKTKAATLLTTTQLNKYAKAGVPTDVATGITQNLREGYTLEEIRQNLASQYGKDTGYQYLDSYATVK